MIQQLKRQNRNDTQHFRVSKKLAKSTTPAKTRDGRKIDCLQSKYFFILEGHEPTNKGHAAYKGSREQRDRQLHEEIFLVFRCKP